MHDLLFIEFFERLPCRVLIVNIGDNVGFRFGGVDVNDLTLLDFISFEKNKIFWNKIFAKLVRYRP